MPSDYSKLKMHMNALMYEEKINHAGRNAVSGDLSHAPALSNELSVGACCPTHP